MLNYLDVLLENAFFPTYVATLLLAIYRYPKYFDTPLKFIPILLMYTVLNELFGFFIQKDGYNNPFLSGIYAEYRYINYTIYNTLYFLYFYYVYYQIIQNEKYRSIIKYGTLVYIIVVILNAVFQSLLLSMQLYNYVFGGLLLILCAGFYIYTTQKQKKKLPRRKNMLFWISIGFLVFYTLYIPIKVEYNYITKDTMNWFYKLRRVHLSALYIMYGCFIYGFLQMKGKLKFV